jgi:zinc protease
MMSNHLFSENTKVFPYDYTSETLENGLKVYLIPMESNGLATYYTIVRTGARDEVEAGKTGFAHFFEHMMFRGTKKYPKDVLDSITTSIGADANAYTTDDYTAYHYNIAAEDLEKVMDIESERFKNLYYEEEAFQTEAGAVFGEYRKNKSNPWRMIITEIKELAFEKHPYKHSTIGYEADIIAMPTLYEYSKEFHSNFYRPENCILVIAGDFEVASTMAKVKEYYLSWEKGYAAPEIPQEPEQTASKSAKIDYPGATTPKMAIGFKCGAYDPTSKVNVANQLLASLAFGSTSDINKKLVLEEQKATFVQMESATNRDPYMHMLYTELKNPSDLDYVQEEILATLEWFKNNPVDQIKLDNLKKKTKYSFLMGFNTPDNVAGGMARFIAVTGGIEGIENEFRLMNEVTPEDIMEAAKQFDTNKMTVVRLIGEGN